MSEITIGRDPEYRGGKYVVFIDGQPTQIWAAHLKRAAVHGRAWIDENYPGQYTTEMTDAAVAFDFPAWIDPLAEVDLDLRCACGEWCDMVDADSSEPIPLTCKTCNRSWIVTITVSEATP